MDAKFEATVQQEIAHLQKVHPKPEDIPSCYDAFTMYTSCNLLRSQCRSLYRYGERAECSRWLEDWKWCLSQARSLSPDQKRDAWIRRRAEWWARTRLGRNSEDVWDYRTQPLVDYPKDINQAGRITVPITSPLESRP
ncbi:hypothetical protein BKA62DRAFT_764739 [Auriculariales sp. MPI-PUGE-AT-0066]|nr:hypothetical protein BKA62DRAFT_764739 [Auriculariales sp. MPI-PUGE-AT-0066]